MEQYCQVVVWLNLFNWLSHYIFVFCPSGLTYFQGVQKLKANYLCCAASISAQYAQTYGPFNLLYCPNVKNKAIHMFICLLPLISYTYIFPEYFSTEYFIYGPCGSIFQGTTLGIFPLRYCRWPPPSLPALSFFWHQNRPTSRTPASSSRHSSCQCRK